MRPRTLPDASAYPIPADIVPGKGWSPAMLEMATHIGARATLAISERFGGEEIRVPIDPKRNPFRALIGAERAERLSAVYGGERIAIPMATVALAVARRGPLVAAVRAGRLSVTDLARALGMRRDSASKLVNATSEGIGATPAAIGEPAVDPRQLDMFFAG
jgi:hypothetical protein